MKRKGPISMPTIMTILTPATDPSGCLRQVAKPVTEFNHSLFHLVSDLHATLNEVRLALGFGRAMAAPQVGISRRIIVINLGAEPITLINPTIIWRSDAMQSVWDDCLSTPDVMVNLERHQSISIRYQDVNGTCRVWEHLPDNLSELLQHEMEHLDGVLMIDHASPEQIIPASQKRLHATTLTSSRISLERIKRSSGHINAAFLQSPLTFSASLSQRFETRLWLKDETDNPIHCF
jgi:peptide deformylase